MRMYTLQCRIKGQQGHIIFAEDGRVLLYRNLSDMREMRDVLNGSAESPIVKSLNIVAGSFQILELTGKAIK